MNRHALEVIQFPDALGVVAGYASSELGAAAVRAFWPSDMLAEVATELLRVDQMLGLLLRVGDWGVPVIPDVRRPLRRLAIAGSALDGTELRDVGELARSSHEARRTLQSHREHFPLIAALAEGLHRFEDEEEAVRRAIDSAGGVRDDASRDLARIRREMRGARSRIVSQLEQYISTLPSRFQVPDASVTVRDGRYVVPVRREGRGEVGGVVHDESATGHTLFIEPPIALELMNRLRELEMDEAREVQRVLRELTEELRPRAGELSESLETLVTADTLVARARYALQCNGRRPEIVPPGTRDLRVVRGLHPLLLAGGGEVIPFDLTMEGEERTLLVSGPNTGGKTVLLKALALIAAMAQAGIIPPVAEKTRLPIFTDFFADIGDEQSIEASLSTFSAHLKNLREILEHSGPHSLALIDEIGSGTDPAEGGALAQAILMELTGRGALTVATTHLGQLKELATEHPGVVNASLQFDSAELRPTYRLLKGVPGRSYGLAIARRLGLPTALLERAEALLPTAEREAGQLLAELERKEQELEEALADTANARARALAAEEELAERAAALKAREKSAERRARQQARDLLLQAREEVESTIRGLRAQLAEATESVRRGMVAATDHAGGADTPPVGDATDPEAAFREARRRIEEGARRHAERQPSEESGRVGKGEPIVEVGARVRIATTGATGTVVELRDGRAVVDTGGLRMQVAAASLEALPAEPAGRQPPRRSHGGWTGPERDASSEVDLRGMRAEEIRPVLEPAIDDAYMADLRSLRIIHGKGTGALRQVVAEILDGDRRIAAYRPGGVGEGGAGVTVVEFT
jgi:DNA mismatch repair protein MutS2